MDMAIRQLFMGGYVSHWFKNAFGDMVWAQLSHKIYYVKFSLWRFFAFLRFPRHATLPPGATAL